MTYKHTWNFAIKFTSAQSDSRFQRLSASLKGLDTMRDMFSDHNVFKLETINFKKQLRKHHIWKSKKTFLNSVDTKEVEMIESRNYFFDWWWKFHR